MSPDRCADVIPAELDRFQSCAVQPAEPAETELFSWLTSIRSVYGTAVADCSIVPRAETDRFPTCAGEVVDARERFTAIEGLLLSINQIKSKTGVVSGLELEVAKLQADAPNPTLAAELESLYALHDRMDLTGRKRRLLIAYVEARGSLPDDYKNVVEAVSFIRVAPATRSSSGLRNGRPPGAKLALRIKSRGRIDGKPLVFIRDKGFLHMDSDRIVADD